MRSLPVALGALLLTAPALVACGSGSSSSGDSSTYDVVYIAGLSGPYTELSGLAVKGLEAAADDINAQGGINGEKVEIKTIDSGGKATQAVTQLQRELQDDPDLVIPGLGSDEALAMLPMTTQAKVLTIATGASQDLNDPEKFPYHFMLSPQNNLSGETAVAFAQKVGATKVGIIEIDSAIGESLGAVAEKSFQDAGFDPVVTKFASDATDLTPSWSKLVASGVDFVMAVPEGGAQIAFLLSGRQKAGFDGPTIDTGTFGSVNVASIVGAAALENVYTQGFPIQYLSPEEETPSQKAFREAILAQGDLDGGLLLASFHYDGLERVALAANAADSSDVDDVARELETMTAPADAHLSLGVDVKYTADSHQLVSVDGTSPWRPFPLGPLEDGVYVGTAPAS